MVDAISPGTQAMPVFVGLGGNGTQNAGAPKAYLNMMVFDKNYQQIGNTLYTQISTAAEEDGTDINHEFIPIWPVTIEQPGYVYIYLSNENGTPVEVFFDDFKVTHIPSDIVQKDDYYPFGGRFNSYSSGTENKYLYQGKELLDDLNLNISDFEARGYDPVIERTWQLDPHADKYPSMSPYSWVANNPILMIDPDGKDFLIWYTDDKGRQQNFRFTGTNADGAPKNEFVQQFLSAYNYNVENGGGEKMQEIAGNSKALVNVAFTEYSSQHTPVGRPNVGNIYWNPMEGAQYENGTVVSPATVLEHESDHANQRITNYEQYREDTRSGREEVRVIESSERKTARANREIPANGVTRTRHEGQSVITHGPTSNKVNPQATQVHRQRLIERQKKARDINW